MRANHQQDQIRSVSDDARNMVGPAATIVARMRPASAGEFSRISAEPQKPSEPTPIWMAALIASRCHASGLSEEHAVAWKHVAGRALYTNRSPESELILPLGVRVDGGHTVVVSWVPGETAYTVEVHHQYEKCL